MPSATPIELARQRAVRLYPRGKNFRTTYVAGARARLAGQPSSMCPYRGTPGTWSVAWRLAWIRGYQSVDDPLDASGAGDEK